jgi:hypothetical protein
MSDWKEIIVGRHKEYINRRTEIYTKLRELFGTPSFLRTNITTKEEKGIDEKLYWTVEIGEKTANITEKEITERQSVYSDENGNIKYHIDKNNFKDLEETLKEILLEKFVWL